ncbi:hypothetical protein RQP46_001753 [Phenoliferia psychrophenolica]
MDTFDSTSQTTTVTPSFASRRQGSSHPTLTSTKPLVRPTPRSSLLQSPTRSSHGGAGSHIASSRPYSPPQPAVAPKRPQSFVQRSSSQGVANTHAQNVQKGPTPEELIAFAGLCRALYYDKDAGAAQAVDSVLNRLPAGSRTAYARTMASVRSQFHRDEEIRRRSEVERALALARPGKAIMERLQISEGGTVAMRSPKARKERADRLAGFIKAHCLKGLPGTLPFFRSLYAVLYLQQLKASKGGAGKRRVEWEVDVTVFSEAGGGTWMQDSIDCLKSVLGFTEKVKERVVSESYFDDRDDDEGSAGVASPPFDPTEAPDSSPSSDSDDEPADLSPPLPAPKRAPPVVPPHRQPTLRTRAISDPFLDPNDRRTPVKNGPLTPSSPKEGTALLPPAPSPMAPTTHDITSPLLDAAPPPQFRIFTVPSYLTDPELHGLLKLFPDFVTTKAPRFATSSKSDEESAGAEARLGPAGAGGGNGAADEEVGSARIGHGVIRIGAMERDDAWRGTGWQRFILWLKAIFGG